MWLWPFSYCICWVLPHCCISYTVAPKLDCASWSQGLKAQRQLPVASGGLACSGEQCLFGLDALPSSDLIHSFVIQSAIAITWAFQAETRQEESQITAFIRDS